MSDKSLPIAGYLAWDEDELLAELGRQLLPNGIQLGLEDFDRARKFAVNWLESRSDQIRQDICGNPATIALLDKESADMLGDITMVASLITSLSGHPGAAALVAIILMRRGLKAFCGGESGQGPVALA